MKGDPARTAIVDIDSILADIKGFFGQEPASTRELIATLDEPALRTLRDQLYPQLKEEFPATAGRPMTKRIPGNKAKLADDVWAFGASLAKQVLLKEADSVLKPPDRRVGLVQCATQTLPSAESDRVEALISNMARIDREAQDLRASHAKMKTTIAAQQVRIANLEEREARCAARDESPSGADAAPAPAAATASASRPPPLETPAAEVAAGSPALETTSGEGLSESTDLSEGRVTQPSTGEPTSPAPDHTLVTNADVGRVRTAPTTACQTETFPKSLEQTTGSPSGEAAVHSTAVVLASATSATDAVVGTERVTPYHSGSAPAMEGGRDEQSDIGHPHPTADVASEMARSFDIDRLAGAIVGMMQQRAGPTPSSDYGNSDSDDNEPVAGIRVRRPPRVNRLRKAPLPPPMEPAPRSAVHPSLGLRDAGASAVTGTSKTAEIKTVQRTAAPISFVLEGVHPDTPDSTVLKVVSSIARSLSKFQKQEPNNQAKGKSFMFTTDSCEENVVLDPANWPLGLQVRKTEGNRQQLISLSESARQVQRGPRIQRRSFKPQRKQRMPSTQQQQQSVQHQAHRVWTQEPWKQRHEQQTMQQQSELQQPGQWLHQEQRPGLQPQSPFSQQTAVPAWQQATYQHQHQPLHVQQQPPQSQWSGRTQAWQASQLSSQPPQSQMQRVPPPPQQQPQHVGGIHGPPPRQQHPSMVTQQLQQQHPPMVAQQLQQQHPSMVAQQLQQQHPSMVAQQLQQQHPSMVTQQLQQQHPPMVAQQLQQQHPSMVAQQLQQQHPSMVAQQLQQQHPPMVAQQLQQQQQQPRCETQWPGQHQLQMELFRTESWPSLPSRQFDRQPLAASGPAAPPVAAAYGNGHWAGQ